MSNGTKKKINTNELFRKIRENNLNDDELTDNWSGILKAKKNGVIVLTISFVFYGVAIASGEGMFELLETLLGGFDYIVWLGMSLVFIYGIARLSSALVIKYHFKKIMKQRNMAIPSDTP